MAAYYVNRQGQANGDHEVHKEGCRYMPIKRNRLYLGEFSNCIEAVRAARTIYHQADGCYRCCPEAHTS